ncbi:MAG: hypothetical protein RL193_1083 [Actinomycetota bacterium]|jgi:FkbM family methyltransferase
MRYKQNLRKCVSLILGEQKLSILDIGAQGGIEPRWKIVEKNLDYMGLEGDSLEFEKILNDNSEFNSEFMNKVVGKESALAEFYISKESGKSSLYKPNFDFLSRFEAWDRFEPTEKIVVQINRIDDITSQKPDFIKLDIQGGELDALMGAINKLDDCMGIEVEVEFSELYESQPRFSEINSFLETFGFEFIDFVNLRKWQRTGSKVGGQLVFGDALYIRKTTDSIFEDKNILKLCKLISILVIYGKFDYVRSLLRKNECKHSVLVNLRKSSSLKRIENIHRNVNFVNFYTSRLLAFMAPNHGSYIID